MTGAVSGILCGMRYPLLTLLLLSLPVFAEPITLTAEDWARPRSGAALTQHAGLAHIVRAFERQPDSAIVIAHSTGEDGQLWAEELRSWFVALGVSSTRLQLESRPGLQEVLILDVRAVGL
jgi:hypothetical protein